MRTVLRLKDWIVALIFGLILSVGCGEKPPPDLEMKNKLIWVEDLDGRGGLMDGSFGDIVLYDLQTKERYELTNDNYYDAHPSWSKVRRQIVFESKRSGSDRFKDMSTPSNLFFLNIKTLAISSFDDEEWREKFTDVGYQTITPSFASQTNRLAFGSWQAKGKTIWIYNFDIENLEVVEDSVANIWSMRWSDDDRYLIYSRDFFGKPLGHSAIVIYNLNKQNEIVIQRKNWLYQLGSARNDQVLYYGYEVKKGSDQILYIKDLTSGEDQEIFRIDRGKENWAIGNPAFGEKGFVYFLRNKQSSSGGSDVWKLDILRGEIEPVTTDGRIKSDLIYIGE